MKKIKYILLFIALIIAGGLLVWKFVINKPTKDYSDKKPEMEYTFADVMKKIETDSTSIKNKLIAVTGNVKMLIKDSTSARMEIGNDSMMSSITCDIDFRHIADFDNIKEGNDINIKGIVSVVTVDPDSPFGNTIQMTYCVLNKK